ncbi:GH11158 [Drosophila grimshawi]|uniref:Odorant receptor n=1 Tax=Drosophila grimshawi TaxID=7222 RepID=B4JDC3_DROGR|nr:GH11158 [Drosophila grimshawi]
MGVIGNKSDTLQFSKFIASHIKCYDIQNGYPLNTPAIVHFSCNNVVANLRNRVKHQVALLLGGYDNDTGSLLSSIDAQGSSQTLNYAVYGMGYSVCNRILQKTWKPDLPFDEAHEIIRAVELSAINHGSNRNWKAVVLNVLTTVAFPIMLAMAAFSFELPLDNLMNFNISVTSLATSAKFIIYVKQLHKVLEIEQLLAELDARNFVDDLFPPMVLILIAGQCELLFIRISHIGYDRCDQRANEQKLIDCIEDQQKIYRIHELTMDIISWPLLVQFVVISIDVGAALCTLFFYVNDVYGRVYYVSFIFALALQIFPVCYYGTMVDYQFERLQTAVYSSNWIDQSLAYRRSAIIFAERTQRLPKQLAGNFIPIALTTFLANCKAAYSFCTLIADTRSED